MASVALASVPLEQQDPRGGTAAGGDHRRAGVGHLAFAGVVAELGDGLVQEAVAVGPAL